MYVGTGANRRLIQKKSQAALVKRLGREAEREQVPYQTKQTSLASLKSSGWF